MNSFRYTNAMLTIIALAFSVIALENFIRPTVAQSTQIQPVAICDMIRACTHKRGLWSNVRSWGEPDTPGWRE